MFKWFASIGLNEENLEKMFIWLQSAGATGKNISGSGDRVPTEDEIKKCSSWLNCKLIYYNQIWLYQLENLPFHSL